MNTLSITAAKSQPLVRRARPQPPCSASVVSAQPLKTQACGFRIDHYRGTNLINLHSRYPAVSEILPTVLVDGLSAAATLLHVRAGQTVMTLGAQTTGVYLVLEGRVQVALYSLGGQEVILRDMGIGELLGELAALDSRPRSASIIALVDCVLASIPGEEFRNMIGATPEAALWLVTKLADRIRDLTEKMYERNTLRVASRLHCELLRLCASAVETEAGLLVEPAPTHAELAARIGTHREAITREMAYLLQQGIIVQMRRRLLVTNVADLLQLVRSVAGESSFSLPSHKPSLSGRKITEQKHDGWS